MTSILCLSANDVAKVLSLDDCISAVEQAFASYARKESLVFPVVRELVPDSSGIFGVKSGYLSSQRLLGFKAGGFWADNRSLGLSTHQSIILLFDPATGLPQAIVDANVITRLRTGAVGALAARFLAPPNAERAAVIGCGVQGEIQTRALSLVLPRLREIKCFDIVEANIQSYLNALIDLGVPVTRAGSVEEAVRDADVIITTTPSWEPFLEESWVKSTAHISAIGADTRGKQELDVSLFRRARVVVDDWKQAREIGESQHAYRRNWVSDETIYAELGDLCAGWKTARDDYTGLTIFDATGIALQDLAAAGLAVQRARESKIGTTIEI